MLKDIRSALEKPVAIFITPAIDIGGIGTGAAYASGDAFGGLNVVDVPVQGIISNVWFFDKDDEGLAKEIVLFDRPFQPTADNSAFAPLDDDLSDCVGVINIDLFYNYSLNQVGNANPALLYHAPLGKLWFQSVTRGADNIAAGSVPQIRFGITE